MMKLLLGQVAEMIVQSRKPSQTRKGAKRQSVQTATTATNKTFEKKKKIRVREQRVLGPNRLVKGCARVSITIYPDKYPDVGIQAQMAQQTSK